MSLQGYVNQLRPRKESYVNHVDKIKRYITLDESYKNFFKIPKDVCILNIRGGEYKRHRKFILTKYIVIKYYRHSLIIFNCRNVVSFFVEFGKQ